MGEWRYSSTILDLRSKMEESGQLYVPAALFPGKELPVPFGYEAVWVAEAVWTFWRRE
jgi:hypothetical protein